MGSFVTSGFARVLIYVYVPGQARNVALCTQKCSYDRLGPSLNSFLSPCNLATRLDKLKATDPPMSRATAGSPRIRALVLLPAISSNRLRARRGIQEQSASGQ